MRFKGKKPIFSYKDTYNIGDTLDPIIHAGLKKFYEVKHSEKRDWFGVPGMVIVYYQELNNLPIQMDTNEELLKQVDLLWDEILLKMIYAFDPANEPNILEYDFDWTFNPIEEIDGEIASEMELKPGTESEYARYRADKDEWLKKVKEGRELFIKFYNNIGW